jgi:hypothetical protein
MGFIEEKKGLIDEIGIFKTINDIPDLKSTSSFETVDASTKNLLPYLLQLFSVISAEKKEKKEQEKSRKPKKDRSFTFGKEPKKSAVFNKEKEDVEEEEKPRILKILLEILTEFLPELIRILKEALIAALKEALACGSDFVIPPLISLVLDVKNIDYNNIFKLNADSGEISDVLFGDSDKDFDKFLYDTIQNPNNMNTWYGPNGALLDVTFVQPGQIDLAVNSNYDDKSFDDFLFDFMASIELFNKQKFIATIIDFFFSNITSQIAPTIEQLLKEEQVNATIDKILNTDPCYDEIVFDNSFFSFSNDDLAKMEAKAKQRKEGVVLLDLGCGVFNLDIRNENANFKGLLDELKNTNDPVLQEKKITQLLDKSQKLATSASPENEESIKNKMSFDFLLELPKVIIKNTVMTPKILGIYNLSNYIVNNIPTIAEDGYEFVLNNRVFFEYVTRESLAALIKIIFNKLKILLLELIAKVVAKLIKKIARKKLKIIASYSAGAITGIAEGLISGLPTPQISGSENK